MRASLPASCLLAALLCAACGGGPAAQPGTVARFDPATLAAGQRDFFGLPFPTDLRRTPDGLDLSGFPNPAASTLLSAYQELLRSEGRGFGGAAPLFVTFSAAIDPASLPADAPSTLLPAASVFAVDLDAGTRTPLQLRFTAAAGLFLPANTLALLPLYGVPLAAGHRHALVVTDGVRDAAGKPVTATAAMRAALGLAPATDATAAAARVTAPFVAWAKTASLDLAHVALASVFTVADTAPQIASVRAAVQAAPPAAASGLAFWQSTSSLHVFQGTFASPVFQQGKAPYLASGGGISFAADGSAVVQGTQSLRFALTLPRGPPPPGGFPVVLYAHGTGGSFTSAVCEGLADGLAARGIATLATDQVLHGPRNPGCTEPRNPGELCLHYDNGAYESCTGTAYFNLVNPYAGRDNTRQGAADLFQLLRLAQGLDVPAALHPEGIEVRLDSSRIAFLGHSQGGLTGTPFVAAEPRLRAAVLSGSGATLAITLLQRKDPLDFKAVAELLLGIDNREPLDPFHPVVGIVQTIGEPADPLTYAPHLVRDPIGGGARHLMLTEGVTDSFVPEDASEALGAAALLDIGGPALRQSAGFTWRGLRVLPLPLQQNATTASGATVTAALLQYPALPNGENGHFVLFDNPVAHCRYESFVESALKTGVAVIPDACTAR